jgi:hypothetical protein
VFRSGFNPPRVISILLAEYENCSVLVAVLPIVWFNVATKDLLGWSQFESTAGNGSSPQRFAWMLGASFCQLSCV